MLEAKAIAPIAKIRDSHLKMLEHYCPANAGMLFANLNDFNELR
jgi:hypothetical protein